MLLPSELAFGVAMFPRPRAPLMRARVDFALFLSFFLSFVLSVVRRALIHRKCDYNGTYVGM